MKQKLFVTILFLSLVLTAPAAFGQRASVNTDEATGTFEVATAPDAVSVRYSLAPAAPDNLVLQLIPRSEFQLNAHITDSKGQELLRLKPETVTLRYANSMDISTLAPGDYFLEIINGNTAGSESSYRIPFRIGIK